VDILGVVKLVVACAGLGVPVVNILPPDDPPYQSIVSPAPGVAEIATVPVPHLEAEPAVDAAGSELTVKFEVLVAVPPGVVTDMVPVVPLPTVAVISVELVTVNKLTAVPPTETAVVPERLVPEIVTVPTVAQTVEGVKEVIVGVLQPVV
jgi:hypothetical protein